MRHTREQLRALGHRVGLPDECVDRRTTTLVYPGTNDVVRRVKLDLPIPGDRELPVIGRDSDSFLVPYPVGYAARGLPLVGFSLTVNGAPASLLTRAENQELTAGALLALLPPSIAQLQQVRGHVNDLVSADDSAVAEHAATNLMAEIVASADGGDFLQDALEQAGGLDARAFGRILDRLLYNYVLYARVPEDCGRALISREADHSHPWAHPTSLLGWWDAQAERWLLRWPTAQVNPEAADAASTHLEITLPDGVAPVVPEKDGYALDHAYLEQLAPEGDEWVLVPGETSGSRLHFYTHSRLPTTDAAARFQIRVERGGWLPTPPCCLLLPPR